MQNHLKYWDSLQISAEPLWQADDSCHESLWFKQYKVSLDSFNGLKKPSDGMSQTSSTATRNIPRQHTRRNSKLENRQTQEIHTNHNSIRHVNRKRPLQCPQYNTDTTQLLILSRIRLKLHDVTHAYSVEPSQDGYTLSRQGQ